MNFKEALIAAKEGKVITCPALNMDNSISDEFVRMWLKNGYLTDIVGVGSALHVDVLLFWIDSDKWEIENGKREEENKSS